MWLHLLLLGAIGDFGVVTGGGSRGSFCTAKRSRGRILEEVVGCAPTMRTTIGGTLEGKVSMRRQRSSRHVAGCMNLKVGKGGAAATEYIWATNPQGR
jgi:hypothetical protein